MKTVCLEVDLQLDVDHSKVGIYAKGRVLNLAFEDVGGLFTLRRSIRNRVRWWRVGAWFAAHGLTTRFRMTINLCSSVEFRAAMVVGVSAGLVGGFGLSDA